jgi:hypothetical protein
MAFAYAAAAMLIRLPLHAHLPATGTAVDAIILPHQPIHVLRVGLLMDRILKILIALRIEIRISRCFSLEEAVQGGWFQRRSALAVLAHAPWHEPLTD